VTDDSNDDAKLSRFHGDIAWWKLQLTPGSKRPFGGEKRIAAYLYFNVEVGETEALNNLRRHPEAGFR
jgi:hypothetical protein